MGIPVNIVPNTPVIFPVSYNMVVKRYLPNHIARLYFSDFLGDERLVMSYCHGKVILSCKDLHDRMNMVRHHNKFVHPDVGKMVLNKRKGVPGDPSIGVELAWLTKNTTFFHGCRWLQSNSPE